MGHKFKSEVLKVRVEPDLKGFIAKIAREREITESEVVREILRRQMAMMSDPDYEVKMLEGELEKVRTVEKRIEETIERLGKG